MLDFPNSPTNGQVFTVGSLAWTWDGTKWVVTNIGSVAGYLPLTGGTLSGPGNLTVSGVLSVGSAPPAMIAGSVNGNYFANTSGNAIAGNAYLDTGGTWRYVSAGRATVLNNTAGSYDFYNAPIGGAGAAITWTNRLNISNTGNLTITGNYLYFFGGSGAVNTTGGPLIFADGNNIVFKPGAGSQALSFQNYAGTTTFGVNTSGALYLNGTQILQADGPNTGYNRMYDNTGLASLHFGGTADPKNYYRQTTHLFQSQNGGVTYLTINSAGLTLSNSFLYLQGASGTVGVASGPLVYGDANYLVFKPGPNNLGWLWWDYNGRSVATLSSNGSLELTGSSTSTYVTITTPNTNADAIFKLYSGKISPSLYDWQIIGKGLGSDNGELWFYNGKTGALPMYIDQAASIRFQGGVVIHGNNSLYVGNPGGGIGAIRITPGGTTQAAYLGIHNPDGTRLGYLGNNTLWPSFTTEVGSQFRFYGGQLVNDNGLIVSMGASTAGFWFQDRVLTSNGFLWYASSDIAVLYHSVSGDKLYLNRVTNALSIFGSMYIAGSGLFINNTGVMNSDGLTYTVVADPGHNNITLGNNDNFYQNNTHNFQNRVGGNYAYFTSGGTYNATGNWIAFSDASLKEDVTPFEHGLEAIAALRPVMFRYKEGTPFADDERKLLMGLVAQEVEEVIPEIIGEAKTHKHGVVKTTMPTNLVYPLINAIKELKDRLEALEEKYGRV